MNVYLDASVLVALITQEPFTSRAEAFLRSNAPILFVSDFAGAEFASAIARRLRMGEITRSGARAAFATFDGWSAQAARRAEIAAGDVATAASFLRRLDLTLRTPDAMNIAMAKRLNASLFTFDEKMAVGARTLGVALVEA